MWKIFQYIFMRAKTVSGEKQNCISSFHTFLCLNLRHCLKKKAVHLKTSNICVRKLEMFKITGITVIVIKSSVVQGAECSQMTVFNKN